MSIACSMTVTLPSMYELIKAIQVNITKANTFQQYMEPMRPGGKS